MENNENMEIQDENLVAEQEQNEDLEKDDKKKKKKKKRIGRIIFNVITFIIAVIIILDVIVGVINMQRISNEEEPIWYLSSKKTETELKTVTEYHLGLYKIVKTDTARETKTTLKPFFFSE